MGSQSTVRILLISWNKIVPPGIVIFTIKTILELAMRGKEDKQPRMISDWKAQSQAVRKSTSPGTWKSPCQTELSLTGGASSVIVALHQPGGDGGLFGLHNFPLTSL